MFDRGPKVYLRIRSSSSPKSLLAVLCKGVPPKLGTMSPAVLDMKCKYHNKNSTLSLGFIVTSTLGDSMFERCTASMKPRYL